MIAAASSVIAAQRQAVLDEAASWIGTPYHPCARVKGAGADCLTFIAGVYEAAGLIEPVDLAPYPPDWHLHHDEERYLKGVLDYCVEIDADPLPADIALWRFGRCYSHGAIVIAWPEIIHAQVGRDCGRDDARRNQGLAWMGDKPRPRRFFRYRGWP